MTSKAILRTAKLKNFGNIGGSLAHNYRTINTPNADPNRTPNNIHSLPNAESVKNAISKRLPEKRRSDAVLCIEYLITASPEWDGFKDKDKMNEYFERSIKFLHDKHGKDNVVATSIHLDESTPHLVAYVVPLDDNGKLNCKQFLGGRKKLTDLQTDFANKVKDLGLERGKENSKATHKTIKEFYSEINNTKETLHIEKPDIKKGLFESSDDFSQKVVDKVMEQAEILHRENRQLQLQNSLYQEQIKGLNQSLDSLNERTKPYLRATENLKGDLLAQFNNELPDVRKTILDEHNRKALEQERIQREQAKRLAEQRAEQERQAEKQRLMREKQERFFAHQQQIRSQRQKEMPLNASRSVIEPQQHLSATQVPTNAENALKTQHNANFVSQWDRNQLRERGLSYKQAEFVMSEQFKILARTINNDTARQEQLQEFQEKFNQIIDNQQLDDVMKSYGKGR